MITEDYVSIETAKLLREKGFDWMESPFYPEQDRDEWKCCSVYTVPNPLYNPDLPFDNETIVLCAPHVSLQLAMKWLRKEHNIFIQIREYFDIKQYQAFVSKCGKTTYCEPDWFHPICDSPEEACEVAIKYCLENLI